MIKKWIFRVFGIKKKPIITVGKLPSFSSVDSAYAHAIENIASPIIGEEIGNHIYYKNYCAEIIEKTDNDFKLVSCGWVERKKCRLIP